MSQVGRRKHGGSRAEGAEAQFSVLPPTMAENCHFLMAEARRKQAEAGRKAEIQKKEAKKSAPARPLVRALARSNYRARFAANRGKRNEGMDLTKLGMPTDMGTEPQVDNGVIVPSARVEVIFRNHRERLLEEIANHRAVIGCVAWLTDVEVLSALQECEVVSLVVQKEDFLKPDTSGGAGRLRKLYDALPKFSRYQIKQTSGLSYCSDSTSEAVRCVGNHNFDRKPAFPRMHNKFLVFCDLVHFAEGDYRTLSPVKVWTGSYNISDNASRSWENAIIIDDRDVASAYANEFGQIFAFSESLDWSSPWCEPTYRWGS